MFQGDVLGADPRCISGWFILSGRTPGAKRRAKDPVYCHSPGIKPWLDVRAVPRKLAKHSRHRSHFNPSITVAFSEGF
jgi:hypothetical protein